MTQPDCSACRLASRESHPPGGWLPIADGLIGHAVVGGSPIRGWVVVTPCRHVEHVADLSVEERETLFAEVARVAAAQRSRLGAEKSYIAVFAEILPHLHVHVVPRYPDTPTDLRGPRAFQASAEQQLAQADLSAAVAELADELAGTGH